MNVNAAVDWVKKHLVVVVVAVFVVVALIIWYAIKQSVISEGNKQETQLSAAYSDGANYLSNCVIKTRQAANVADQNAAKFDQVIKDAVAGSGEFHTDTAKTVGGLFPLLVQAYPDLKGQTDLYNKVADIIVGCQDDFRGKQSVVLDQVRKFNSWRTGSWTVRTFGGSSFPNSTLKVSVPGVPPLTGQSALDKISQPIVDAVTSQSYQTGQQSTEGPFATQSPTK